jgi:hypothetical protein
MIAQLIGPPALGQWRYRIVTSVTVTGDGMELTFAGGDKAVVAGGWTTQQALLPFISYSLRYRYPVAFQFGPGNCVSQGATIDCNEVTEIADNERHPHLLDVTFCGEPAPKYLARGYPRYQEMLDLVRRSNETGQPVWCVIQGSTIVDVQLLTPEEDEVLGRWMQEHGQGAA